MHILIFGSRGWIGSQFIDQLKDHNISYVEATSRADNEVSVENEIMATKPTHVISFIGRTHGGKYNTIDYLEQPGKLQENMKDNLYGPFVLAQVTQKHNIHYSYLGTGCIFCQDDPTSKLYTENDQPDFFGSSYSTVKGFTDRMMHFFPHVLNLRIRMPITNEVHIRNFITKITQYENVCSIPNSMTVLPTMFPLMIDMMKNNVTGTINLTNPGLISHNEILTMYKEIVDPNFTWRNFDIEQQNAQLASKRSNNQLDTQRLQQLYPNVPHIKDAVRSCLVAMKHYK
jgi:dTDP-4-dehydrorhamnose reductase